MNKHALDAFVKCAEYIREKLQLGVELTKQDRTELERLSNGKTFVQGINDAKHIQIRRLDGAVCFVIQNKVLFVATDAYGYNMCQFTNWKSIVNVQSEETQRALYQELNETATINGIINKQEELRAEVESLKGQLESCHSRSELQRKEIDRLNTEKKLLTAKVEHFEKVEARQAHDLNKLRYWKEAYLASCRYRERLNHVIHKYKKRVARTHNALKIANDLLADAKEETQSILTIANEDIENLRHQVETSEKRLGHERQAVLGLQGQIREMATSLNKALTEKDKFKEAMFRAESQKGKALKQAESLKSDLGLLRLANSEKVTKINMLEHDVRVRDGWLDDERKRVKTLEARIEELTTEQKHDKATIESEIVDEFLETVPRAEAFMTQELWDRFEKFSDEQQYTRIPRSTFRRLLAPRMRKHMHDSVLFWVKPQ